MSGGDPIVIHGPSLGDIAALLAVGGCLVVAVVLLLGWLFVLEAPAPSRWPDRGPGRFVALRWLWACAVKLTRHTVRRVKQVVNRPPPPPLDDAPTVHLHPPLSVPRQREGDHDDDHRA